MRRHVIVLSKFSVDILKPDCVAVKLGEEQAWLCKRSRNKLIN